MMNASKIPSSLLDMIDTAIIEIKQGKLGQGFESESESQYSDNEKRTDPMESTMRQNNFQNGLPSAMNMNEEIHYDDTLKPDQCTIN